MKKLRDIIFAIRRFFIIGSGGYTRYSDYPDFDKKVAEELLKLRERRRKSNPNLGWGENELYRPHIQN